jgi:hypothetical protein
MNSRRFLPAIMLLTMLGPHSAFAKIDYLVERPVIKLSLEYQKKDETRSAPDIGLRSEQTDTFWQRLELESRGWLYHPDLLLFSFGLEPQWKQQDTAASDAFFRSDNDNFLGYFLDAHVLRQKSHSFKLFLRQSRNEFNSTLSPDNVSETDIARTVWIIKNKLFPTTVTVEKNDTTFDDFFSSRDDSNIFRIESKYVSDKHQLNLLSEYVDQLREIDVQRIDAKRSLLNMNSHYMFSDSTRLTSTIFTLDSQSDVSDSRSFLWSERLMLQHRPKLRSEYNARFDSRKNNNFHSDTQFLSGALEHQLYENLTTRIDLYTSKDDFDNGEIDVSEADLDLRYRRKIPVGMLAITGGYAYRVEDNNIDATSSQILNESHVLVGTAQEFLAKSNIDVSSVIVTDITKTTIYVQGIDYFLGVVGESVVIERGLFGGISDGETVLVDYVFATQSPFKSDRRSARFGINLDLWQILQFHYNFSRVKEDLISGIRPSDLADDRIQRVGASLRWRWSTTTAEYERRETIRTPLTRRQIQQAFVFRMSRAMSFGASASYSETDFKDTGSDTQTVGIAGNLRWDMGRWGRFEVEAFSRDIDGESQQIKSDGLISRWSVRYGDWSGFVRYEDIDEMDDLTLQFRDRRLVTVHISRTFR